jgi:hypothetical protein
MAKKTSKRMGRPNAELLVSAEQRDELERYVRGRTVSQASALRARIVLACATGKSNVVERELGLVELAVGKCRKQLVKSGIDWLSGSPRPNVHRKLADEKVEQVTTRHWKRCSPGRPTGALGRWRNAPASAAHRCRGYGERSSSSLTDKRPSH